MAHEKKRRKPNRDFVRQMIRALIVLALAVTVFILSGNDSVRNKIKKLAGAEASAAVSAIL